MVKLFVYKTVKCEVTNGKFLIRDLPLNKSAIMVKWKCLKLLYSSIEICSIDRSSKNWWLWNVTLEAPHTFFSIFSWYFSFTHTEHSIQGVFLKVRACVQFFRKGAKKGKIFESLSKNVQNLKIFLNRTGDCVRLSMRLMVKSFQRSSQVLFPCCWSWPSYWSIIWKFNTTNRVLNLKNARVNYVSGVREFMWSLPSLFKRF